MLEMLKKKKKKSQMWQLSEWHWSRGFTRRPDGVTLMLHNLCEVCMKLMSQQMCTIIPHSEGR